MLEGKTVLPLGGPLLVCSKDTRGLRIPKGVSQTTVLQLPLSLRTWCPCLNLVLLHLPRPAASSHGPHATLATAPDTGQHYLSEEGRSTAHVTSLAISSTSGVPIQSLLLGPFKSLVFLFVHTSLEELNGNPCVARESY